MALAATLLPSGRVKSVMDRTTLGLAKAGSFTSSETYMHKKTDGCYFKASLNIILLKAQRGIFDYLQPETEVDASKTLPSCCSCLAFSSTSNCACGT